MYYLGAFFAMLPLVTREVAGKGFPFEAVQLNKDDVLRFPAISFGNKEAVAVNETTPRCRAWPSSEDWPPDFEWKQLNASLGGALLRPVPAASACYQGDRYNETACNWLVNQAGETHFWLDEPLSTLTQWPQGSTCMLALNTQGSCTRGGYPEYVVNATAVRQIQAAVNFARNKNVRLVIKNTGHDFGGRSMGAGSLSIWVHNLKSFEFIPEYKVGPYSGMAVRVGAGVESWELFNHMAANNISVVSPGGVTVGVAGGWLAVAGHGSLTSKYGLGVDQVLSINIVTADGKFLTVDPNNHEELWWALRGGGPGTFGVITSVIFKAYPPTTITAVSLKFAVNFPPSDNTSLSPTLPGIPTLPEDITSITSPSAFWRGVSLGYHYCPNVIAAGGYCYSYIYPLGPSTFAFTSAQIIPNITAAAATALLQPLYTQLNALAIPVILPTLTNASATPYSGNGSRTGTASPVNTRYRSRLFPARLWANTTAWDEIFASIRTAVEQGGYTFHGIAYSPTARIAGWPGRDSAVHPAWRETALHGSLMEVQPEGLSAAEAKRRDVKADGYVQRWRELTPGSGAYMNEGDPAEGGPLGWQWAFFGSNYPRLRRAKLDWDPWGVFWARTTVGSEGWEVVTQDGYPAGQNGRLCRVRRDE